MMLFSAFLLVAGLAWAEANVTVPARQPAPWTFKVKCHSCLVTNSFNCGGITECSYEIRRCMTVAIRLSLREVLVFKGCTWNCTFVYLAEQPPEMPKVLKRTNSLYFVRCCGGMVCNAGGPSNLERDILPDTTIEEELPEGAVRLGDPEIFLSLASMVVGHTLT